MSRPGYVYMLASARYGTLYIGVTSNLIQRVWQHRETQLKHWNRTWKINLIHKSNPLWRDLFDEICG